MEFSTNEMRIVPVPSSGDVLTEVIRQGAKQLLSQAIEAEVAEWIKRHQEHQDAQGRQRVVRNGFLPPRTILTGVGPVDVSECMKLFRRIFRRYESARSLAGRNGSSSAWSIITY